MTQPDSTETSRRERIAEIGTEVRAMSDPRAELEAKYGQVWTTDEMQRDFEVVGFAAPFVVVRRRSDDQRGSLEFAHSPRFYFNFLADR